MQWRDAMQALSLHKRRTLPSLHDARLLRLRRLHERRIYAGEAPAVAPHLDDLDVEHVVAPREESVE